MRRWPGFARGKMGASRPAPDQAAKSLKIAGFSD